MKNLTLKSLFVFLVTLFTSQVFAQENESPVVDAPEEVACIPYPRCKWLDGSSSIADADEKSQLALLWDKLTREMKEVVKNLPSPANPE